MNRETKFLAQIVEEGYGKRTWHGTNLRGSIRGLGPKQAAWRPSSKRHNIWEIVVHAAYWKYTVRRRLLGEKRGSFPLKGSNWFRRPEKLTPDAWRADVQLLQETHDSLVAAIKNLSPSRLHRHTSQSKYTDAEIIFGIAAHDIYHAGQIQLLKRLQRRTVKTG